MCKITVEVSQDFLFEACALVHSRWSKENDALKTLKQSKKTDSSEDWAQFQAFRLSNQTAIELKWKDRRDEAANLVKLMGRT